MRSATAGLLKHLVPIEREKLFILPRPPRESVNAIKSEHVIDAKEMKNASNRAHTFAPPLKIVRAHPVPVIERNAPVLSPFLRELVVLEVRFGRCAAGPIEHEFIPPRQNVGAIITNAKRNITHERNAAFFGIRFYLPPLLMRDPLHITEVILAVRYGCLLILWQRVQPGPRSFH